jgi:hypothetical protein
MLRPSVACPPTRARFATNSSVQDFQLHKTSNQSGWDQLVLSFSHRGCLVVMT